MNTCVANWANIATIILAVAAIVAAYLAIRNIKVLREQNRRNTFFELMSGLADDKARYDRKVLHKIFDRVKDSRDKGVGPDESGKYPKRVVDFFIARGGGIHLWKEDSLEESELLGILRTVQVELGLKDIEVFGIFRDAFEEVISLFDRVGFFLLRGDSQLIGEAPRGVWDMTVSMWKYVGDYVENRQKAEGGQHVNYGCYFGQLALVAPKYQLGGRKKNWVRRILSKAGCSVG